MRTSTARAAHWAVALLLVCLALPAGAQRRGGYEDESDEYYYSREQPEPPIENRAVSEPHFVGDFGARFIGIGDIDSQAFAGGATWYTPIGESLGIGLGGDLGFGAADGDFGEVVGLHGAAFWRDPRAGYLGAAVVFDHVSDFQRVNVSAIAGGFVEQVDLLAQAGYEAGDGPEAGVFSFEVGYYTSNQFRLGGNIDIGTEETVSGGLLLHWQPAHDSPVTLRADIGGGEFDDEGFYSVGFGITFSFSARKSLRDQLRGDRLKIFE